jgi:hypothetical protein
MLQDKAVQHSSFDVLERDPSAQSSHSEELFSALRGDRAKCEISKMVASHCSP